MQMMSKLVLVGYQPSRRVGATRLGRRWQLVVRKTLEKWITRTFTTLLEEL
jgi:hypothetical protein